MIGSEQYVYAEFMGLEVDETGMLKVSFAWHHFYKGKQDCTGYYRGWLSGVGDSIKSWFSPGFREEEAPPSDQGEKKEGEAEVNMVKKRERKDSLSSPYTHKPLYDTVHYYTILAITELIDPEKYRLYRKMLINGHFSIYSSHCLDTTLLFK